MADVNRHGEEARRSHPPGIAGNLFIISMFNRRMEYGGCVYIMTNFQHTVLYIGVTSNLPQRIFQHKRKEYKYSFTSKYNCDILVWYESFSRIEDAIAREKQLKAGNRKKKEDLINAMNPNWNDLWEEVEKW